METKENLLRNFNNAFANADIELLSSCFTDDISWNVIGELPINGKDDFLNAFTCMLDHKTEEMKIYNIIVSGQQGVVDGTMTIVDPTGKRKTYEYCDLYRFSDAEENKIQDIKSFVLEPKKEMQHIL